MKKLVFLMLVLISCMDNNASKGIARNSAPGNNIRGGRGAGPYDGSFSSTPTEAPQLPGVELTNFVDPSTSNYVTKLTLPKNFIGYLYLSGLNITSLSKYHVIARFRFGREQQPIDIETSIGRVSGVIPNSDKEVLQLDMTTQPFINVRLLYDLYDYTDYRNDNGNEDFVDANSKVVGPLYTSEDSLNFNLYCRGLDLAFDPTFKATSTNKLCDEKGEMCLYSYAKIVDKSLVGEGENQLAANPINPQLDSTGLGYTNQSFAENITKCFPDNESTNNLKGVLNAKTIGNGGDELFYNDQIVFDNGSTFLYQGPFRTIGYDRDPKKNTWQIIGNAMIYPGDNNMQALGLFQKTYIGSDPNAGFISLMFPRAGRLSLKANTEYWGSEEPLGPRTLQKTVIGGPSLFMDGSNVRVKNYNSFTNEGIGSCNVTATIDLITTDPVTGKEVSLLKNPDIQLKLQLVRPTLKPPTGGGVEVLYQSMQNCTNNNGCGNNECCFGGKCWDKKLVSSCLQDDTVQGNRATGQICRFDLDCSSLCCDKSTGVCGVQIITEQETYLCSKAPGQTCVTKEYCRLENITSCYVVKTGTSVTGKQECALRCYNNPTFGECRNGYCIAPTQPPVPAFNPTNPDCTTAIDPPIINQNGTISTFSK